MALLGAWHGFCFNIRQKELKEMNLVLEKGKRTKEQYLLRCLAVLDAICTMFAMYGNETVTSEIRTRVNCCLGQAVSFM